MSEVPTQRDGRTGENSDKLPNINRVIYAKSRSFLGETGHRNVEAQKESTQRKEEDIILQYDSSLFEFKQLNEHI